MKMWVKYLISVFTGCAAGIFFPIKGSFVLSFVVDFLTKFGEYCVVPVVFFSFVVSIKKLKEKKEFWKALGWSFFVIVIFSLILTLLGALSIMSVHLPRIPISFEKASEVASLNLSSIFTEIFPSSAFSSLNSGTFLLPVLIFAAVFGFLLSDETEAGFFRPVNILFLAFSRVGYKLCKCATHFFTFALTFWSAWWLVSFRENAAKEIYVPLLLLLAVNVLLAIFVVYPLITRILCNDKKPYRIVYAALASSLVAFFTSNRHIALLSAMRHTHDSLGVRRRINAFVHPIFSLFSGAGIAMVTTVCFIVLYRSYSTLDIAFMTIVKVVLLSFLFSFLLGKFRVTGVIVCLALVAKYSAKGFEHSYLILLSLSPVLASFASFVDIFSSIFGTYIVSVKTKYIRHHAVTHYI